MFFKNKGSSKKRSSKSKKSSAEKIKRKKQKKKAALVKKENSFRTWSVNLSKTADGHRSAANYYEKKSEKATAKAESIAKKKV